MSSDDERAAGQGEDDREAHFPEPVTRGASAFRRRVALGVTAAAAAIVYFSLAPSWPCANSANGRKNSAAREKA